MPPLISIAKLTPSLSRSIPGYRWTMISSSSSVTGTQISGLNGTPQEDLILMSPASESGRINAQLIRLVGNWAEMDGSGIVFDSSSGFTLPNRAMRTPDVAWIQRDRWQALTPAEWQKFAPICPDFDPQSRRVHIYRPTAEVEVLQDPNL